MKKRILSMLMALLMVLSLVPTVVFADTVDSGSCGTNLTWTLDDEGTLTISGTGAMKDWPSSSSVPWSSHRADIETVVIDNGVTTIGECAFYHCDNLTQVMIPDSVASIRPYAFAYCGRLMHLTLPVSVRCIDDGAFYDCSDLRNLYYTGTEDQAGIISVGDYNGAMTSATLYLVEEPEAALALGSCGADGSELTWVLDTNGILVIFGSGEMADWGSPSDIPWYDYAYDIELVWIDSGVTSIGNHAFDGCGNLRDVMISDGVTSIGDYAFDRCSSLTSAVIPDSLTSIGKYAFYQSNLQSVTIPDSVTRIGEAAFDGCSSLQSVTIGEGVTSIGRNLFGNCGALQSVTIPDSVTSIGNSAFGGCSSLVSIEIPDSVTSIGFSAFNNCSGLTNVTIPDGVTSIDGYTFYRCSSLQSVTVPDSVTSIGGAAFDGCSSLQTVYYSGTQDQWSAITIASDNEPLRKATKQYDHAHQFTRDTVVAPTCTESGYTEHLCAHGETVRDCYTAPLGHTHAENDQGVVTKPNCPEQGYTTYTCDRCGKKYQADFVDAQNHYYEVKVTSRTCTKDGYTTYICAYCGDSYTDDYTEAGHHVMVDGEVEATCVAEGYTMGAYCDRCGEVFITSEVIPATGEHHFVDGKCEVCGCNAVMLGDVDGNGKVNMADVTKLRQYLTNKTKYPLDVEAAADVDNSGKINMADVTKIRQYLTNKDKYPLG